MHRDVHQPDAREDRRDVRLAQDDVGRQRAQVLRVDPHGDHPRRAAQEGRVRHRQPHAVAPPFTEVEFDIYYGKGVCQASELVDMGTELGIVQKSGSWYSVDGDRIGQGRDTAREYLIDNPKVSDKIRQRVLAARGLLPVAAVADPTAPAPTAKGKAVAQAK
jgi:hypothetical protein